MASASIPALSWTELQALAPAAAERSHGPATAQADLRLFGQPERAVRVTLYRDHHAWCPYCQKIWLWLECRRIPYRVRKVTMRCYGPKEPWYSALVPSGMLPALELDGQLITESDRILAALEQVFGPLGAPFDSPEVLQLRQLERRLFRAWCVWLCSPALTLQDQEQARSRFQAMACRVEAALDAAAGPWLGTPPPADGVLQNSVLQSSTTPGTADLVLLPFVERMNASLAYYKGYALRQEHPAIDRWLARLEQLEPYRATQGDAHTHAHDLPPQMGCCVLEPSSSQQRLAAAIDSGEGLGALESRWQPGPESVAPPLRALERVLRHRVLLQSRNPLGDGFDQPLRAALTHLVTGEACQPAPGSAAALRHLRDRISVPRDMPLLSARALRQALEATAALDGSAQSEPLPVQHRFDQDPRPFLAVRLAGNGATISAPTR